MKNPFKSPHTRFYNILICWFSAIFALLLVLYSFGLRANFEYSLEQGIYHFKKPEVIERGDIVKFITSPEASKMALERNYTRPRSFINPEIPVDTVKIAEGVPGDSYEIKSEGVFVNGKVVPSSAQLVSDSVGRPMPVLNVKGVLGKGQYIVMSQGHKKGYDSRYYGYITKDMISGVGRQVVRFYLPRDTE